MHSKLFGYHNLTNNLLRQFTAVCISEIGTAGRPVKAIGLQLYLYQTTSTHNGVVAQSKTKSGERIFTKYFLNLLFGVTQTSLDLRQFPCVLNLLIQPPYLFIKYDLC